jgi:hypothetical protein
MGQATVQANQQAPKTGDLSIESCRVFSELAASAGPNTLVRFVVGEDHQSTTLGPNEIALELGDPFATLLLAKGIFPQTAEGVFEALDQAIGAGDVLGKESQRSFILGEGSQIPFSDAPALNRAFRFVVTRGSAPEGPDLIVSAFFPDQADDVELMAWDRTSGGFNFYRSLGTEGGWVFAGNSRRALADPTQGKGPFESHKSGNFLMKELRAPWINWHSPDANILPTAFAGDDRRRNHPWFTQKEPQGALVCEAAVARPSISRWVKARFDGLTAGGGAIEHPVRIMQQILDTPTANLITSHTESEHATSAKSVDLPQTFFVDSEALTEILGLRAPPNFTVAGSVYAAALQTFAVKLTDNQGFERRGDTHFAFVVPERAFEDQEVLRAAMRVGLVSERLAASLLMTDFSNPIFSERRTSLLKHVPANAQLSAGPSSFSGDFADAILAAAQGSPDGSPEREFAERWNVRESFKDAFNALLGAYYSAVTARLATQEGFNDYFQLAESRRQKIREMPIFESPLLFAETNIPLAGRAMRPDGTVATEGR